MTEPTADELKEAAANAAKEVLDGGAAAYSHAGRSVTKLDPEKMHRLSREIEQDEQADTYGVVTLADMRS
jgi:DNA-directed RNA polymerase subunit F